MLVEEFTGVQKCMRSQDETVEERSKALGNKLPTRDDRGEIFRTVRM